MNMFFKSLFFQHLVLYITLHTAYLERLTLLTRHFLYSFLLLTKRNPAIKIHLFSGKKRLKNLKLTLKY